MARSVSRKRGKAGHANRKGGKGKAKFGKSMGPKKQVMKGLQKKRMHNQKIISAMK